MNNLRLILGSPGTGKTTSLLSTINGFLSRGIRPDKIGYISFTRKAVNEARDRAMIKFKKRKNDFTYFRTIHSLAFRMLSMSTTDIMGRKEYRELGELLGLEIKSNYRADLTPSELSKGDEMVFLESLSRLAQEGLETTYSRLCPDFSLAELRLYQQTLIKYKSNALLYDFTDLLEKYLIEGYKPKLDVLVVDEGQDLSPLQWRIVEELSSKARYTYVAGDDDQAIFRWSGADVEYFIDLANQADKTKVLKKSYRLSKNIYTMAQFISGQIAHRNEKEFSPTKSEGSVQYVTGLDDVDLDKGQWLILVRNIYLIPPVIDHLRMAGYAYESAQENTNEMESLKAALDWEKLRAKKPVALSSIKTIFSYMQPPNIDKSWRKMLMGKGEDEEFTMDILADLCGITCQDKIWHKALNRISVENREYFIAVRRRGETLVGKPRIKISTIHGVKGGEAENVVLFTDMSARTHKAMNENPDDEARVYYVGVTRTKENLFIVQPRTPYSFNI